MHTALAFGAPEYTLTRTQWVSATIEEVFSFFENPHNLSKITPSNLGFHILAIHPDTVQEGTQILYRLKWHGIPYRWQTLIEEWVSEEKFVDVQQRGPYIQWHHTHTFTPCEGGVLVEDCVRYRLPFGKLGTLVHKLVVHKELNAIFDYRMNCIAEHFTNGTVYSNPPHGQKYTANTLITSPNTR